MNAQPNKSDISKEERLWGTFAHLASFAGLMIPFGNLIGPLVIWLVKRESMSFVDDQGKEAVNFGITVTGGMVVLLILLFASFASFSVSSFVSVIFLTQALTIVSVVFGVIAAIKANEGNQYRYPATIRFIK